VCLDQLREERTISDPGRTERKDLPLRDVAAAGLEGRDTAPHLLPARGRRDHAEGVRAKMCNAACECPHECPQDDENARDGPSKLQAAALAPASSVVDSRLIRGEEQRTPGDPFTRSCRGQAFQAIE
jgi:hypothetical protein